MNITGHTVEKLYDPTGILVGDRYEFFLNIEVPEEDELFSEFGVQLRVIMAVEENNTRITQYHFIEQTTNQVLNLGLDEEEEEMVTQYCRQHIESL